MCQLFHTVLDNYVHLQYTQLRGLSILCLFIYIHIQINYSLSLWYPSHFPIYFLGSLCQQNYYIRTIFIIIITRTLDSNEFPRREIMTSATLPPLKDSGACKWNKRQLLVVGITSRMQTFTEHLKMMIERPRKFYRYLLNYFRRHIRVHGVS